MPKKKSEQPTSNQVVAVQKFLTEKFGGDYHSGDAPMIHPPEDACFSEDTWELVWEEGPYDWAIKASELIDFTHAGKFPKVWCEPYNSFTLNVYKKDW